MARIRRALQIRRCEPRQWLLRDAVDRQPARCPRREGSPERAGSRSRRRASSTTSASSMGLTWPGTSWSRREDCAAGEGWARSRSWPSPGSSCSAARSPRPGPRRSPSEYWIAAVPVTWNVVPNGRNAIEGETFTRAETTLRTIVYRRYTKNWVRPHPRRPDAGRRQRRDSGAADPRPRRRADPRPLQEPRQRVRAALTRCTSTGSSYPVGSDGAYLPGFSGPGRERQARAIRSPTASRPGRSPRGSGLITTTHPRWTTQSTAACTARSPSSAEREKPPGSRVRRLLRVDARLRHDQRPRLRR